MSEQSIDTVYLTARGLSAMLASGDHENLPASDLAEIWSELLQSIAILAKSGQCPPELIGQLIKELPLTGRVGVLGPDGKPRYKTNRRVALATAEALGEDAAQDLYHFAVLVTKLS